MAYRRQIAGLGAIDSEGSQCGQACQRRRVADLGALEVEGVQVGQAREQRQVADLGVAEIEISQVSQARQRGQIVTWVRERWRVCSAVRPRSWDRSLTLSDDG
jgi:hypothetical protein